jgi:hypothetical protein
MAAKMAMIAITTNNSIKVKALARTNRCNFFIFSPRNIDTTIVRVQQKSRNTNIPVSTVAGGLSGSFGWLLAGANAAAA